METTSFRWCTLHASKSTASIQTRYFCFLFLAAWARSATVRGEEGCVLPHCLAFLSQPTCSSCQLSGSREFFGGIGIVGLLLFLKRGARFLRPRETETIQRPTMWTRALLKDDINFWYKINTSCSNFLQRERYIKDKSSQ